MRPASLPSDPAVERIAKPIADRIAPTLVPDIEVVPWRRTHLVVVRVHPSPTRPHHLRALGPEADVFVRVGSTNRRAEGALIEELRRYVRNDSSDEQPLPELDSEAIDFRAVSESFAEFRRLRRKDLETLRITARHQGRAVPTVGGVLPFGRDHLGLFPDAWIPGRTLPRHRSSPDPRHRRDPGPPAGCRRGMPGVRRADRGAGAGDRWARRTERWAYPLVAVREAVREAVVNAIVHADYAQHGAPSGSRSSTTVSRWRTRASCRSASPSRRSRPGSPSFATASSGGCFVSSDSSSSGEAGSSG